MKYRLLDILACPICKKFPLELIIIERKKYERELKQEKPFCELYCGYLVRYLKDIKETPPCDECIKYEIVTGVLYCNNCKRWYPIIDEIPRMLPDELRKKSEDLKFLKKYSDKIPERILSEGKPFNLKESR